MLQNRFVIVSRHKAVIDFAKLWLEGYLSTKAVEAVGGFILGNDFVEVVAEIDKAKVLSELTLIGNVPLWAGAKAYSVCAVEFDGAPPRGREYTLGEMIFAVAKITPYKVDRLVPGENAFANI